MVVVVVVVGMKRMDVFCMYVACVLETFVGYVCARMVSLSFEFLDGLSDNAGM